MMTLDGIILLFVFVTPILYRLSMDSLIFHSISGGINISEIKQFVMNNGFILKILYRKTVDSNYFKRNLDADMLSVINSRRWLASVIPIILIVLLLINAITLLAKREPREGLTTLLLALVLIFMYLRSYRFGSNLKK